jgi:Uma2 family endonuclease
MAVERIPFTVADYERLPEGFPAELIDGELVREAAPTWDHQAWLTRVFARLLEAVPQDRIVVSPIDVFIDDRNVLQPDLLVLSEEAEQIEPKIRVPIPLMVIEVLSPSTAARDREEKAAIYLRAGVREVWLVDRMAGEIEILSAEGARVVGGREIARSRVLPGVELAPNALSGD